MTKKQTVNPYIEKIRQALARTQPAAVDWLVLAHNDARLLERLDGAFPDSLLAVVAVPQSLWRMDEEMMTEVVAWAVEELKVEGVLLVGHSQGGVPEEPVKLLGGKVAATSDNGGELKGGSDSLLDRVRKAQDRAAGVQDQFAEQVERLSQRTAVKNLLNRNQMQLHGLFYRRENGVFYLYEQQLHSFRPLLNETGVA